jgi:hypothetical protein
MNWMSSQKMVPLAPGLAAKRPGVNLDVVRERGGRDADAAAVGDDAAVALVLALDLGAGEDDGVLDPLAIGVARDDGVEGVEEVEGGDVLVLDLDVDLDACGVVDDGAVGGDHVPGGDDDVAGVVVEEGVVEGVGAWAEGLAGLVAVAEVPGVGGEAEKAGARGADLGDGDAGVRGEGAGGADG